jgi:hypothetical protein
MVKRRARLTDENDPLSSTDKVLAGFEQISRSARSLSDNKQSNQQANVLGSQEDNNLTSQLSDPATSQQAKLQTSSVERKPASQPFETPAFPPVEKSKLRKSTFQIGETVLHQLDQLHLMLQLELGKANAPYKEVIVEEAISQMLEQANFNRSELIKVLIKRQQMRE